MIDLGSRMLSMEQLERRLALAGVEFVAHPPIATSLPGLADVNVADLDGDHDLDILSASMDDDKIAWYENRDGRATFGPQTIIAEYFHAAAHVAAADVDADGDLDILAASFPIFGPGELAWFENEDGRGRFGPKATIGQGRSIHPADLDGDGDVDALATDYSREGGRARVQWFENLDGRGTFGPSQHIWTVGRPTLYQIEPADVDGDGDTDVVSVNNRTQIAWHENSDGEGTFDHRLIDGSGGFEVTVADLDADGDPDVVASLTETAYGEPHLLMAYENSAGAGRIWQPQVISATGGGALAAADVDGDGDVDVISGTAPLLGSADLAWYENTDGQGRFGATQLVAQGLGTSSAVRARDLDGDGDVDVLYASWVRGQILWYENLGTAGEPLQPGDANGDGRFDQLDIVQVLQAGKLATSEPATWAEGDWNADGVFDRFDLIAALQTGNYLQ